MRPIRKTAIACLLVVAAFPTFLHAQDDFGEDSRLNTNMAIPLSVPLNPLAKSVNFGLGTTVGAGYNGGRWLQHEPAQCHRGGIHVEPPVCLQ